jgi:hypothetical protein
LLGEHVGIGFGLDGEDIDCRACEVLVFESVDVDDLASRNVD